jgi:beta-1,4-mannosyltransferase
MAEKLVSLFSSDHSMLDRLKEGALAEGKRRWDDEWDPVAGKLFELIN